MSEEDDWFERALRDLDTDEEEEHPTEGDANTEGSTEAEQVEEPDEPTDSTDPEGAIDEYPDDTGEATSDRTTPDEPEEASKDAVDERASGGFGTERGEEVGGFGGEGGGEAGGFGGEGGGEAGGFGGEGGGEAGGFGGGGDGGGTGESDGFGGGGGGGGGNEFGFADFGEGDEFDGDAAGFGEGGFGGEESFDEEEFESDIERINVGIEGLDEMILGGIPRRSLITTIGSAGTGKTTFGLQFLDESLRNGEKAVYITLEESREAILSTAEEKGWPFRQYEEDDLLAIVALDPIEMANSLASIRNDLSRLIGDFGAERLVLDSVSLLEMMYDHPAKRRSEVFDFTRSLKEAGVTTMLTSEASEENAYASRHGIVEYLTDAVFILQYVRPSDFRETRLAVEIQKIRDANHSRETKPYEITNEGISVYQQANIF